MLTRLQQRRGLASEWTAVASTVILDPGEMGIETDTGKFKIGDGLSVWSDLEYYVDDANNELKYAQLATTNTFASAQTFQSTVNVSGMLEMSNNIDMNNNRVVSLATPTSDNDAATKAYVDDAISGLAWKEAAHLFSNSNVSLTGSTGTLIIDGHDALVAADSGIYRIVLNGQTTATENGIYLYTDNGTNYTLTRTTDATTADQLHGASIYIQEGTTYGTSSWVQSNYTADTFDELVWVQFSGAALITAGNGLTKNGNTIDAVGTSNRIVVNENNIDIASNYVGQTSILTVGAIETGTWEATPVAVAYGGTGATTASDARTNLNASALTGGNTFVGTQDITSSSSGNKVLTINGASGQTGDLTAWRNSSGATLAKVEASGIIIAKNYDVEIETLGSDSVNLDFSGGTGIGVRTPAGNITFTATNYRAGSVKTIFITNGASDRNLTFPANWIFLGSKPTSIAASKTGVLTVTSLGTAEANAVASWVVQI